MEYRFTQGAFLEPGPATVWLRMAVPAAARQRSPRPLQRVLDRRGRRKRGGAPPSTGRKYLFINVDLSVHLHRMPEGEWVCLDAVTLPEPTW